MSQWRVNVIHIAQAKETKRLWKWVAFPPIDVLRECLRDRHCTGCHGPIGPFLFIGKLPDGPYMAFRRPVYLVRNGTLGLVLIPQAPPPAQPQAPIQPTLTLKGEPPEIIRVVDLPQKKRTKKMAKKSPAKTPKKAAKKAVKTPAKKAVKTPAKKAKGSHRVTARVTRIRRRKP